MKTTIALLLFVLFSIDIANGQVFKTYGLKFGFTSATLNFEYSNSPWRPLLPQKYRRRSGFNIGAFAEWLNNPFFSVITQLEYSQRGVGEDYYITGNDPTPIGTETLYGRLDYISLPIMAKIAFPIAFASPYLLIGPRADFLLGYQKNQPFEGFYDTFKKTTFGGVLGLGIESNSLLPVGLSAEFRYNTDFSDSFDNGFTKIRNNAFDIWLGVAF